MTQEYTRPQNIIFVCSANTCRSPMAEYIFRDMTQKEGLDINIMSRGNNMNIDLINDISYPKNNHDSIGKYDPMVLGFMGYFDFDSYGNKMTPEARKAILDYNPDMRNITHHRSRNLTLNELISADLILTMEKFHRNSLLNAKEVYLKERNENLKANIYTLSEYAEVKGMPEVRDPIAAPSRTYSQDDHTRDNIDRKDNVDDPYKNEPWKTKEDNYIRCRDEIISYLKILLEDLKNPEHIREKIQRLEANKQIYYQDAGLNPESNAGNINKMDMGHHNEEDLF